MKNKHLTHNERIEIEKGLNENCSFKEIAARTDKSLSTISKEIKIHRYAKERNYYNVPNICMHRRDCTKSERCDGKGCNRRLCDKCNVCNQHCKFFEEMICPKLQRAPLVCNGCHESHHCHLNRYYYDARKAQNDYESDLSEKRQGINMTEADFVELSRVVCALIENGQSISAILKKHKDLGISARTLYSYVEQNLFSVRNMDLPRKIRCRKRSPHKKSEAIESSWRKGRSYNDYQEFISISGQQISAQMDTVEGKKSGSHKVLFTLMRPDLGLLLAFLLERKTQHDVKMALDALEYKIGKAKFQEVFPVIVTDNGTEFQNPDLIETSVYGGKRTRVFYADPYSAYQKGSIENAHQLLRRYIPKGISFSKLTEENVQDMVNNINSYSRESLDWLSPYEKAREALGPKLVKQLGLKKVPSDDIILRPILLQMKVKSPQRNIRKLASKRVLKKK